MSNLIEEQCRYLVEQAAKIGVDVVVMPTMSRDFIMKRKGSDHTVTVRMEDKIEDFNLKVWKLMD